MSTSDDFDWNVDDNPDVVVTWQNCIAVYENVAGSIVIRRERAWDEDDDVIILVTKASAPALAQAILRAAGVVMPTAVAITHELLPPPPAKDPTAAERQRRFRNRHRNGDDRDGHAETAWGES